MRELLLVEELRIDDKIDVKVRIDKVWVEMDEMVCLWFWMM